MLELCLVMFRATSRGQRLHLLNITSKSNKTMMGREDAGSFPFYVSFGDFSGVNSLLNFWMISWWLNHRIEHIIYIYSLYCVTPQVVKNNN